MLDIIKDNKKTAIIWGVGIILVISLLAYMKVNNISIEESITHIWNNHVEKWGYFILFCWSILEGELGLIFAGLAAHDGKLNLFLAIFVAGLGGFTGDQIYFYIGRFNRRGIQKMLKSQRRKFALAHLLLKKYGWPIIFIQRYMYGMRTIIPMSIGITKYSALKFAFINLISAWAWAAITILLAWYFGEQVFIVLDWFKDHPYLLIPLAISFAGGIYWYLHNQTKKSHNAKDEIYKLKQRKTNETKL